MRHFFLSLLILLTCLAWGRPISAFGAAQKPAATRHGGDERKKNATSTSKTADKKQKTPPAPQKNSAPAKKQAQSSTQKAKAPTGKAQASSQKETNQSKRSPQHNAKPGTSAPNTAGIRKLQNEKANLQREMNENSRKLSTTQRNVSSGLAHLQVINGQISDQQRVVNGIRHDLDTLNRSIGRHESELQVLERQLTDCKRRYARGIIYLFRNRLTQNKLMFIFSSRNFSEMYRRIRYVQEYTRYQRAQGLAIAEREAVIRGKREQLSTERGAKNNLLTRGKEQQSKLENQQREQQQVVDDLNRQQRELQATIAAQQARHTALNNQIDRLIQEELRKAEQRRREEEARRKRAEDERRRAEEARRRAADERRKALEAARRAEEEAKRKAEETKRKAEEARRKAEQAKRKAEEARRKAEEARKRGEAKAAQERAAAAAKAAREAQAREEARAKAEADRAKQAAARKRTAETQTRTAEKAKVAPLPPQETPSAAADRRSSGQFSAHQGRLPAPVNGAYTVTSHYGSYNVTGLRGVTLDNKGINLSCAAPAQARAVYEGDVTAVFSVGGLSNVLIRHGAYISVYCNLARASVRTGQHVNARQPIGTIARDATGRYTLHFQLRHETQKLNPERWLGR